MSDPSSDALSAAAQAALAPSTASSPTPDASHRVRRRRIHYFSGFDPRGASFYHRLFKEQAEQPQLDGAQMQISARRKLGPYRHQWQVQADLGKGATDPRETTVRTDVVFMSWDDLIRAHWHRARIVSIKDFFATYSALMFEVGLLRIRKLHAPMMLALLLPLLFALAAAGLTATVAGLWAVSVEGLAHRAGLIGSALPLQVLVALAVAGVGYELSLRVAAKLNLNWLMRIFTFIFRMSRRVPGLYNRQTHWVEAIIEQQRLDPVDEVLLVGHSVGTLVMMAAVDGLLQDARWQVLTAQTSTKVVTLGQVASILSMASTGQAFRQTCERVATHPQTEWLDVTAWIDPLCMYQTPPQGPGSPRTAAQPHLVAARFFHMFDEITWANLRRNKLQRHFLYLMAPQRPGNINLFQMLFGAQHFDAQALAAAASGKAVVGKLPSNPQGQHSPQAAPDSATPVVLMPLPTLSSARAANQTPAGHAPVAANTPQLASQGALG